MTRGATSAATLAVLVALCAVGAVLGIRALTAELPDRPLVTEPPVCEPRPVARGDVVRPGDVVVSVFNAGDRAGQASQTMRRLIERGFTPADSGNAPEGTDIDFVQVWVAGPKNPAARLVAAQFGPDTVVKGNQEELGVGVMVLVGNRLGELAPRVEQVRAGRDSEICSPPAQ